MFSMIAVTLIVTAGIAALLEGFDGEEEIEGTDGNDLIAEQDSEDDLIVEAGGGSDIIQTGEGDDTIYGGDGDDVARSGEGDDEVFLGDGADIWIDEAGGGGEIDLDPDGDDRVHGDAGSDTLVSAGGEDTLIGGTGDDGIFALDVPLEGGERGQADFVDGGEGSDFLLGDDGDTLVGGAGIDIFGISYDAGAGLDPVTITDLQPDELLSIVVDDESAVTAGGLTYEEGASPTQTLIKFDGETIAILEGISFPDDVRGLTILVEASEASVVNDVESILELPLR